MARIVNRGSGTVQSSIAQSMDRNWSYCRIGTRSARGNYQKELLIIDLNREGPAIETRCLIVAE